MLRHRLPHVRVSHLRRMHAVGRSSSENALIIAYTQGEEDEGVVKAGRITNMRKRHTSPATKPRPIDIDSAAAQG
jgi:hypothetical protein